MSERFIGPTFLLLFGVASILGGGCSSNGVSPQPSISQNSNVGGHRHRVRHAASVVQHVVIIIQENRSFNTIFGGPKAFPNVLATSVGYESNGNQVALSAISLADDGCDIDHSFKAQRRRLISVRRRLVHNS